MFQRVIVKHDGNCEEFILAELDLETPGNPTDQALFNALAVRMNVNVHDFDGYVVDPLMSERDSPRHANKTVLNVRPDATYGVH